MVARSSREAVMTTGILFAAATVWGLVPVATRYLLASFDPLQLVIVRFLIATVFFLPLLIFLRGHRWTVNEVLWSLVCGLIGVVGYYVLVAYGQQLIPAGMTGLLLATQPIWILLISASVMREKIPWRVFAGLVVALGGMVLLLGQETLGTAWNATVCIGALLVVLAALMWSIYTVAVRWLSKRIGARASTAVTMIAGALPLYIFWDSRTWRTVLHLSLTAWLALALLAFGSTVIAAVLWNYGVTRTSSARAGLFLYLVPLVSVSGGVFFLHEQVRPVTLISGACIIAGVALAQTRQSTGRVAEPALEDSAQE